MDYQALAAIVFEEPSELEWLELRLHPLVRAHWQKALASPKKDYVVELPLLYDLKGPLYAQTL